jgi:hypothetical protein
MFFGQLLEVNRGSICITYFMFPKWFDFIVKAHPMNYIGLIALKRLNLLLKEEQEFLNSRVTA